jgi:methionyl-tRNA formyltransferase
VERAVNVVFITTDDPLYLPGFFDRVLTERPDTTAVLVAPPLYGDQTTIGAAWRYLRTFGVRATFGLAKRSLDARLAKRSVAATCQRRGVRCEHVKDVNSPSVLRWLEEQSTDVVVSVSCPQIFKRPLIDLPRLGCLNLHGAILPNYRGVLPSFWMLANGERTAGVSLFFVNEHIDGGDLCGQRIFEIRDTDTLDSLIRRSKAVAAELVLDALDGIESDTVVREPLDLDSGSYYSWPDQAAVRRFRTSGRRLW